MIWNKSSKVCDLATNSLGNAATGRRRFPWPKMFKEIASNVMDRSLLSGTPSHQMPARSGFRVQLILQKMQVILQVRPVRQDLGPGLCRCSKKVKVDSLDLLTGLIVSSRFRFFCPSMAGSRSPTHNPHPWSHVGMFACNLQRPAMPCQVLSALAKKDHSSNLFFGDLASVRSMLHACVQEKGDVPLEFIARSYGWLEIGADRAIYNYDRSGDLGAWRPHNHHHVQDQRMFPFTSITLSQHHRHALATLVGLLLLDRSELGMGAKKRPRSP